MHSLKTLGLTLLFLLLAGCSSAPAALPPATIAATAAPVPTSPVATAAPASAAASAADSLALAPPIPATLTPVPTATARPIRPVTLALPQFMAADLPDIGERLPAGEWAWTVEFSLDPAGDLAAGRAQLALLPDGAGVVVGDRPVAVAVPFTTEWEFVDGATGRQIVNSGHSLAVTLDWAALPPGQKALRVDGLTPADAGYPLQATWSLHTSEGYAGAAAAAAPILAAAWAAPPLVHLVAVGDVMLDRALGYAINQGNLAYPFAGVVDRLQAGDITVGNMESALGDVGAPALKAYPFRAPPAAAQSLAGAGFDIVSVANNHGMDYGPEALLQGLDLLRAAGVQPIGAGVNAAAARAPYITTANGLTFAFLGYVNVPVESSSGFDTRSWTAGPDTPGLAWADPELVAADVAAVRDQVDHVVVILHSGYEYQDAPSPPQQAASYAAIDAGAALVIGHHAHILQGVQYYNGGVIVYGLGNFAFEIDGPPETALLNVWFDAAGVRQIEFVPAVIQFGGQPRLALPAEAAAIRARVYALTRVLNAGP